MSEPPAQPSFDREAARARYRALMRGRFMRSMYLLLGAVLLISWGFGIAAALATDVERLPGHDLTVAPASCLACHAQPAGAGSGANGGAVAARPAPVMPHIAFPTCGFCHRQSALNASR
jgi:hypothetical protein